VNKAFAALDAARQEALHQGLLELLGRFNRGGRETLVAPADYLEVVVTKD
jgi:hypothetical protein